MNKPGDGISKFSLLVANTVAADNRTPGLDHFRKAARKNSFKNREIGLLWKTHQRQRRERLSAHGVNIAKCVGCRNLSERVSVVDDGREEIDSLDQRLIGGDLIHSGVVGMVEAD